jgi:NADH-quinone oxidoreductase subunit H
MVHPVIVQLALILVKIVCLLVAIAYYTIAERKIMAAIQRRRGPNVVGFWGLLQPLADGLKLIAKEMVIPSHANSRIFVIAPLCILTLGLLNWSILPFGCFDYSEYATTDEVVTYLRGNTATASFNFLVEANEISDVRYGLLVVLALSSLTVYGLIIAGWSSNSKYAFLGALRSAAQMISYEVSISLVLIPVIFMSGSLNFTEIVCAQERTGMYIFPLLPLAIIFFISMIAETNRTPFDLPEAEAELVAGYNVEYSSIIFAMFFLAEYGNMIMMSLINVELFFGGWIGPAFLPASTTLALKALVFCFAFVLVRATFPRYRYDQLMDIGWKIFLPISTGLLLLVVGIVVAFDAVPVVSEIGNLTTYSTAAYSEIAVSFSPLMCLAKKEIISTGRPGITVVVAFMILVCVDFIVGV